MHGRLLIWTGEGKDDDGGVLGKYTLGMYAFRSVFEHEWKVTGKG